MNKLYMMIGLPASGKSTIAKEISKSEGAMIVSSDEIRKELLGDINDQSKNELIFETVENRIKFYLSNKYDVIFDATNINYKKRKAFLQKMRSCRHFEAVAVLVATPYEECLIRNSKRERKVPEDVIKRMYYSFYMPQYYEGFDEIQIRYNSEYVFFLDDLTDIEQDNPHHSLSVLEHCKKVEELLTGQDIGMIIAGRLHDIGKLKTKTFINSKGETTEIAHFYNHERVSVYDSLFYVNIRSKLELLGFSKESNDQVLRVLNLIQWHMILHFNWEEKTINKYKKMLGETTWKELEILHEADCEAR